MDDFYKEEEENTRYITILSNKLLEDFEDELKNVNLKNNKLTNFEIDQLDSLINQSQTFYEEGNAEQIASVFNEINNALKNSPKSINEHIWDSQFSSMLFDAYDKMSGSNYFISVLQLISSFASYGSNEVKESIYQRGFVDIALFESLNTTNQTHFFHFFNILIGLLQYIGEEKIPFDIANVFTAMERITREKYKTKEGKDFYLLGAKCLFTIIKYFDYKQYFKDIIDLSAAFFVKGQNNINEIILNCMIMLLQSFPNPDLVVQELRRNNVIDSLFSYINKEKLSKASPRFVIQSLKFLDELLNLSTNDYKVYYFNKFGKQNICDSFYNHDSDVSICTISIIIKYLKRCPLQAIDFIKDEDYFDIKSIIDYNDEQLDFITKKKLVQLLDIFSDKYEDFYSLYLENSFVEKWTSILDIEDADSSVCVFFLNIICKIFQKAEELGELMTILEIFYDEGSFYENIGNIIEDSENQQLVERAQFIMQVYDENQPES